MNHSVSRFLIVAVVGTINLFAQTSTGAESPEALVKQIFATLERKDSAALQQLAINSDEFKKFVWPTFTTPPTGTNAEKFSKVYMTSSDVGINDYLKQYGGRKMEVLKVTLNPPTRQNKNYRLLPGAQITLRDETGREKTVNMLGSILERAGRYKVATYYVRPPQPTETATK
jgi:hypothetical protein